MNQTEHYKLSQWEPSDRVQMEDFNGDNAKVEKALAGLEKRKLEVVKLVDVQESVSSVARWNISLGDINLGNYFGIFAEVELPSKISGSVAIQESGQFLTYLAPGRNVLFTFPLRIPETRIILIGFTGATTPSLGNSVYQDVHSLSVYCPNGGLSGSCRFRMWALP